MYNNFIKLKINKLFKYIEYNNEQFYHSTSSII